MWKDQMPQDSSSFGKKRPSPSSVTKSGEAKDQPMSSLTKSKPASNNRPGMS